MGKGLRFVERFVLSSEVINTMGTGLSGGCLVERLSFLRRLWRLSCR